MPRSEFSRYAWERVWEKYLRQPEYSSMIEECWKDYRDSNPEILDAEKTSNALDKVKEDINQAIKQKKETKSASERRKINAEIKKLKIKFNELNQASSMRKLSKNYTTSNKKDQKKIRKIIWGYHNSFVKEKIWNDDSEDGLRDKLAFVEWNNNRRFSMGASNLAKNHKTVWYKCIRKN